MIDKQSRCFQTSLNWGQPLSSWCQGGSSLTLPRVWVGALLFATFWRSNLTSVTNIAQISDLVEDDWVHHVRLELCGLHVDEIFKIHLRLEHACPLWSANQLLKKSRRLETVGHMEQGSFCKRRQFRIQIRSRLDSEEISVVEYLGNSTKFTPETNISLSSGRIIWLGQPEFQFVEGKRQDPEKHAEQISILDEVGCCFGVGLQLKI